jgi:hypothetical protein
MSRCEKSEAAITGIVSLIPFALRLRMLDFAPNLANQSQRIARRSSLSATFDASVPTCLSWPRRLPRTVAGPRGRNKHAATILFPLPACNPPTFSAVLVPERACQEGNGPGYLPRKNREKKRGNVTAQKQGIERRSCGTGDVE